MQIVIDGQVLDISQDEKVAVTITANSLEDASLFQSSYTNAFAIPPTKQNRTILGDITALDATGTEYLATDVQLISNTGLQILTNGKMLINQFDNEALQVNIIDGIVGFFDEIGDTRLFELDFSAYAHTWNLTNVTADTLNIAGDGYVYAVTDFGNFTGTTGIIDVREQYPSFFVKDLFQLIASQLSTYSFADSEYFADAFFESLVLAFNGEQNEFYSGFEFSGFQVLPVPPSIQTYVLDDYAVIIPNDNFVGGEFVAPSARTVTVSLDVDISIDAGGAGAWSFAGDIISNIQGTIATVSDSGTGGGVAQTITATTSVTLEAGEILHAEIQVIAVSSIDTDISGAFYISPPEVAFGSTLNIESLMPNMKCSDFIKSVWKMLALQPSVDSVTKIITIKDFQTYSTDTASSVDYSSKIDTLRGIEIEYSYGSYAKTNTLKFKADDSLATPEFADSTITISNENLDLDYDMIELDFAPTASITIKSGALRLCSIPILNVSGEITNVLEPRICYIERYTGTRPALSLTDGTTTNNNVTYSTTKFLDPNNSENLSFVNNLKSERFAQFELMIQAMQKVTLYLKLTDNEINDIDFFTLIYLSFSVGFVQLNGYYLMQELKEYTGSETVQVELINVNIT